MIVLAVCTCKASTKWKCSKVVYSIWVGQSEFSKDWSDCYWGLEVADTPNLIIVYASEAHTGNKYVWIRLQIGIKWLFLLGFEFSKDQKRSKKATNVFFNWQRSSKVPKHSSKILCCGVVSHLNVYIHLAYYNRYKCLETPQLHLLGQDILSQMSNLTFIM